MHLNLHHHSFDFHDTNAPKSVFLSLPVSSLALITMTAVVIKDMIKIANVRNPDAHTVGENPINSLEINPKKRTERAR